ncbi:hypothetical protein B296_00004993 [Ensete ventricosum]|uniref:Uncharacterized protein n=1 Tax=Ensete ventricosum TaxID=4639 RepID=A0A426ZK27_ENSVE|nr:hypothetical protein B296_00004993 [Ensete ventricosum]
MVILMPVDVLTSWATRGIVKRRGPIPNALLCTSVGSGMAVHAMVSNDEVLYLAPCHACWALSRGAMPYDSRRLRYNQYFSIGLVQATSKMPRQC